MYEQANIKRNCATVVNDKGMLAMDKSINMANKRKTRAA